MKTRISTIEVKPGNEFLADVVGASNKEAELDEKQLGWLLCINAGIITSGIRLNSLEWRREVTATATWINSCR